MLDRSIHVSNHVPWVDSLMIVSHFVYRPTVISMSVTQTSCELLSPQQRPASHRGYMYFNLHPIMFYLYSSSENSLFHIDNEAYVGQSLVLAWLDHKNFMQWTRDWRQLWYTLLKTPGKGWHLLWLLIGSSIQCFKLTDNNKQLNAFFVTSWGNEVCEHIKKIHNLQTYVILFFRWYSQFSYLHEVSKKASYCLLVNEHKTFLKKYKTKPNMQKVADINCWLPGNIQSFYRD